jgi:hypothetical protein
MERLQQHNAATETQSSPNFIIHPSADRTGSHTERELEAAATMLALRNPVVYYPKGDLDAAYTLLALRNPVLFPGSDSERTITNDERTITADPTPVTTPNRQATPPTATPATAQLNEVASELLNLASTLVSPPPVKKISLEEYTAMKKAREEQEAQRNT